jgi:hypothetical protein
MPGLLPGDLGPCGGDNPNRQQSTAWGTGLSGLCCATEAAVRNINCQLGG